MKYLILLLPVFLIACSSEDEPVDLTQACEPDSVYVGEWKDTVTNLLDLAADCSGTEQYCQTVFTYNRPASGFVSINVTASNELEGCPSVGKTICLLSHSVTARGESMELNCGGNGAYYVPR